MNVAYNREQLEKQLEEAAEVSADFPVVISKFYDGFRECDVDGVADSGEVVCHAVSEHVENAGVHSGDATLVLPPHTLTESQVFNVREATKKIATALDITGPFNVQFLVRGDELKCIECNLRASRSFPFVSKTIGVDFIEAATRVLVGEGLNPAVRYPSIDSPFAPKSYVGVKAPMFSFIRLRGADPLLGVEMASTGEVACFGENKHEALLKAMLSTNMKLPSKNVIISLQDSFAPIFLESAKKLEEMGFNVMATEKTAKYLNENGVEAKSLPWPGPDGSIEDTLKDGTIDLVINLPNAESTQIAHNYVVRRTAADFGIPMFTNLQVAKMFVEAISMYKRGEIVLSPETLTSYYEADAEFVEKTA